jgi:crossover junction endodeoxyribonuclease RuvC
MIILGIDPGLASTGFGAIVCGTSPALRKCGYIKTPTHQPMADRLFQLYKDMKELIRSIGPGAVGIENVFSLGRYPKAGIILGAVLGVVSVSVVENGLPLIEVTPREVKNCLVGYGGASKDQVKETTRRILNVSDLSSFHAADALAVALTVFYRGETWRKG